MRELILIFMFLTLLACQQEKIGFPVQLQLPDGAQSVERVERDSEWSEIFFITDVSFKSDEILMDIITQLQNLGWKTCKGPISSWEDFIDKTLEDKRVYQKASYLESPDKRYLATIYLRHIGENTPQRINISFSSGNNSEYMKEEIGVECM